MNTNSSTGNKWTFVFFYGTMKKGFASYGKFLEDSRSFPMGDYQTQTRHALYAKDGKPMVVQFPEYSKIKGEVYLVRQDLLKEIDAFKSGKTPKQVAIEPADGSGHTVDTAQSALFWFADDRPTTNHVFIPSGHWTELSEQNGLTAEVEKHWVLDQEEAGAFDNIGEARKDDSGSWVTGRGGYYFHG